MINTKNISKETSLSQRISLILFGLFLTIIILEIGLRIGGFTILSIQEHRNLKSIRQKGACRIMCLGESTTQNQYPPYLEEILNQRNIGIKFSVINKGISGINTAGILEQLESNRDKYQPDIVVVMMGINDEGDHMPYKAVSTSKIGLTFRSFKVYKLTRLLWLHIVTKFKEKGSYVSASNNQIVKKLSNHVPGYKSGETHKQQDFFQEELSSKKAVEFNPNNDVAYIQLGWLYKNQGKLAELEQSFKKAIELNSNNDVAYTQLGLLYKSQGRLAEAEQSFKKAIELNSNNDVAYTQLGQLCGQQGRFTESEQLLKKAIELNPKNDTAYTQLGWLYGNQGKIAESEQLLKKAIELNPNKDSAYTELGWLYGNQGKIAESEQLLKKAIELNPNNNVAHIRLEELCRNQERFAELEQLLKKAIELNPENDTAYGGLATIYRETDNSELSEIYAKKANSIRSEYYSPITINKYHTLRQILDKSKIRLVSVQYPMRNIEPLKKMLKEETKDSIVFVDNEKIFKDAVRKEGYKEYFIDMFGGDFGHCTPKGNRLLAENIANVILKGIFSK